MRAHLMPGKRMHVCGPTGTVVSSLRRTCVSQIADCTKARYAHGTLASCFIQRHACCTAAAGQGHPCVQLAWLRKL